MPQTASLTTRDEQWAIHAIVHAHHHDPFSFLGMHPAADTLTVRAFLPQAQAVTLIDATGKAVAEFERIAPEGLFVAHLKGAPFPYRLLGAHEATVDGVDGVVFSVWAPNARRVSVVGEFNEWDGRRHPMRCHFGIGVWELFLPHLRAGTLYKYEIKGVNGDVLPLKAD